MTQEQFIEEIAKYVQKYAPQYDIKVYSPIIAQACLESGYGTSELATKANNYFGLKFNTKVSEKPAYVKVGSEQNPDGSYVSSVMQWCNFNSMESGVEGYFKFLFCRGGSRYDNLKGVTDPNQYLTNIKADGYATSLSYVQNNMNVINKWGLTKYDTKIIETNIKSDKGGNSPLIEFTRISPNKTSPRNHKIDTITIHCMAGNLSIESCGNVFAPTSRKASSNYGIGSDGRIGMYVEEKDRSWCSSNGANDHRAVTIEVANDGGAPDWHVSDKAMESLIKLCADICRRNDIKELKWCGDKNLIGQVDKQNMTVHRWFAAKACPGDYLYNKHGYIASEVNKILGAEVGKDISTQTQVVTPTPAPLTYIVQVTVDALNYRTGPGTQYPVKGTIRDKGKYTIVEEQNGWGLLKSYQKNKDGWIYLKYTKKV